MSKKTLLERFTCKLMVDESSKCWNWIGAKSKNGYGHISVNGRVQQAHRVSYEMHVGVIQDGLEICHRCDNTSCVNPDHLFAGTHKENMNDCKIKGRGKGLVGEDNKRAKLTREDVIFIRSSSMTNTALGKMFGVSNVAVSYARSGKNWSSASEGLSEK